jgi:hypothetical protein
VNAAGAGLHTCVVTVGVEMDGAGMVVAAFEGGLGFPR